jgi:LPS export ABC transporter protein LptC
MWYKLLFALFLAVIGITFFLSQGWDPVVDKKKATSQTTVRALQNVCMLEKDLEKNTLVRACTESVIQYSNNTIIFNKFDLFTDKGDHLKGEKGQYNINRSILNVMGPVIIETKDGDKAYADGLTLDRKSNTMKTNSPVRIEAKKITIEANKAEFLNNPQTLSFSGGVHAKIYSDHIGN